MLVERNAIGHNKNYLIEIQEELKVSQSFLDQYRKERRHTNRTYD